MSNIRTTSGVYLTNNGDFLMMKRSISKKLDPGTWANIGGHVEPHELNDPSAACLREIYEETGIGEKDITELKLKYILLRKDTDRIGIQFLYFGKTSVREVKSCDEGEMHWISEDEVFDIGLDTFKTAVIKHYFETGRQTDDVTVGTLGEQNDQPIVNWNTIHDWNI